MSNLTTLPKGDSAWLFRKAIERIIQQISDLETNIGSSTTGNSANTQIIFNDNGVLRGDPDLTFNTALNKLVATALESTTSLVVGTSATITGDLTVRTNRLATTTTGVGIGTASPNSALEVAGSIRTTNAAGSASASTGVFDYVAGTTTRLISYGANTTTAGAFQFTGLSSNASVGDIRYGIDATGIHTWQNVGGVAGPAMTLNATGLGVGTSPTQKLHVKGVVNFEQVSGGTNGWQVYTYTDGTYRMNYNGAGADELIIDTSGNVGIGVTPSAWGGGYKTIANLLYADYYSNNGGIIGISGNAYNNGTSWIYKNTTAAHRYEQSIGSGHIWYNAPSGTAGNAITFTQAMTLDASGNLLVGKTASSSTVVGAELRPSGAIISTLAASTNADFALYTYSTGAGAARFYVGMSGTVFATNTTISPISSDVRLKQNIVDFDKGLAEVVALRPRHFEYKSEPNRKMAGFIAQEVESVIPDSIVPTHEDPEMKTYQIDWYPLLVKAIQELNAKVQALEAKLA